MFYILREKRQYTVGRLHADFFVVDSDTDDKSVSREHALLIQRPGQLLVVDKSKYGVYVSRDNARNAIEKSSEVELYSGDQIQFGRMNSIWHVECIKYTIVTSALTPEEKTELATIIEPLDGVLLDEWDNSCTHVVMSGVDFTLKALQALAKGIPIVNLTFFKDTMANIEAKVKLPMADDYIPPITDPALLVDQSLISVNADRSQLFAGKTFVFVFRERQKQLESLIVLAKGKCVNLEASHPKNFLLKDDVIFVKYIPSADSQIAQRIADLESCLTIHNKRSIYDWEIGLAIVYCSIEAYCNPDALEVAPPKAPTHVIQEIKVENHGLSNIEKKGSSIGAIAQDEAQVELIVDIEPFMEAQPEQIPSKPQKLDQSTLQASSDLLAKDIQAKGILSLHNINVKNEAPAAKRSAQTPILHGSKKRAFDTDDDPQNKENISMWKKQKLDADRTSESARRHDSGDLFPDEERDTLLVVDFQWTASPLPIDKTEFVKPTPLSSADWAEKKDLNQNHTLKKAEEKVKFSEETTEMGRCCEISSQGTFIFR